MLNNINGTIGSDIITGTNGNDYIRANAGNDFVSGLGGNDTILGESGDDILDGGSGSDTVDGGIGNDTLVYNVFDNIGYTDTYSGGTGINTLLVRTYKDTEQAVRSAAASFVSGTLFNLGNSVSGANLTATNIQKIKVEVVNRQPTDIQLSSLSVSDQTSGYFIGTLTSSDLDQCSTFTYTVNDQRFEIVDGALKLKNNVFLDISDGDTITLSITTKDECGAAYSKSFSLHVVERGLNKITGSNNNDNISGTVYADMISGKSGDDVIRGLAGNDVLHGDKGADTLYGGEGNDILLGQQGNDTLDGGPGNDIVNGGPGDDTFIYNVNENEGTAVDYYQGSLGTDSLTILSRYVYMSAIQDAIDSYNTALEGEPDLAFDLGSYIVGLNLVAEGMEDISVQLINRAPTGISLSATSIAENNYGGVVGILTTQDPDAGDVFVYSLHKSRFEVQGSALKLPHGVAFDYELLYALMGGLPPVVPVTVVSADPGDEFVSQLFYISVTNVNEEPTDILLRRVTDDGTVATDQNIFIPSGTSTSAVVLGNLSSVDPDIDDTFSYSLPVDVDTDNAKFEIVNDSILRWKANEAASGLVKTVHVVTTDAGGLEFAKSFSIPVSSPLHIASLSDIDATEGTGFKITLSLDTSEELGYSVANIGDFNGDGYDDFAIGVPSYVSSVYPSDTQNIGVAFIVFGKESGIADIDLLDLDVSGSDKDGVYLVSSWLFGTEHDNVGIGFDIAGIKDFNGDGYDDILFSFASAKSSLSSAYSMVLFGGANANISVLDLTGFTASASTGFLITGTVSSHGNNIHHVGSSGGGDFNGDGHPDIIASSLNTAYLIFGQSESDGYVAHNIDKNSIAVPDGIKITVGQSSASFVSTNFADVNGDGYFDILLSYELYDGTNFSAETQVLFGSNKAVNDFTDIVLSDLTTSDGFKITQTLTEGLTTSATTSIVNIGDVNGDEKDDIAVYGDGKVSVIYGKATGWSDIDLDTYAPTASRGFVISGSDIDLRTLTTLPLIIGETPKEFHARISKAGDVNNDGLDDFVILPYNATGNDSIYLIYGQDNGRTAINLASLSDSDGIKITTSGTASAISGGGDYNGDGYTDFIVGIPSVSTGSGEAYAVFGA